MKYENIKDAFTNMPYGFRNDERDLKSKKTMEFLRIQEDNKKRFANSYNHYQNILNIYAHLAHKLNLDNSLKICMLFTYLLWNGYFSVNKRHRYSDFKTANIEGLASFDIMNGKGVCLSYSTMLRDFLIVCGYDSANLVNYEAPHIKYSYMPKIIRDKGRRKKITIFEDFMSKIQAQKTGNHTFTLINENGNLYVYDPTNLTLVRINNLNEARVVNGKGIFKIMPYISSAINIPVESTMVLERLYKSRNFTMPYTNKYYRKTFISLIAELSEKIDLLDEYYNMAFYDINYVAKTAEEEAKKR